MASLALDCKEGTSLDWRVATDARIRTSANSTLSEVVSTARDEIPPGEYDRVVPITAAASEPPALATDPAVVVAEDAFPDDLATQSPGAQESEEFQRRRRDIRTAVGWRVEIDGARCTVGPEGTSRRPHRSKE